MRARGAILLAAAVSATLVACGSGERTFSAEELVEEANSHGAGLVLGEELETVQEGVELRAVELAEEGEHEAGEEPGGEDGDAHAHGGGSLAVLEDAEAARAEYERCESAVSLVCFRAANVALIFEAGLEPAEQRRIADALAALAEESG